MSDWLFNLPVVGMGVVILAAVWLVTAGIYRAVTVLATGERGRAFTPISRHVSHSGPFSGDISVRAHGAA